MAEFFRAFYERWLAQQESLLQQLLIYDHKEEEEGSIYTSSLISRVLCHYKEFHDEKARATNEDPFLMISPPWLSSYERTLLWLTGFKPSTIFQLAKRALRETLSDSQSDQIESMWADTRREEKEIEKVMATIQESMADLPTYGLISRFGGLVDGEISRMEEAMRVFKDRVIAVLEMADSLRGTTVSRLLNILIPAQSVKFLAASVQYNIRIRRLGLERDNPALSNGHGGEASTSSHI